MSLRATGDGHISSIVFRSGVLDRHNRFLFDPISDFVRTPDLQLGLFPAVFSHVQGVRMYFHSVAKLSRFKDIVTTLLKYGLDEVVQRLNFPGAKLIKMIHPVKHEMGIYERIRCVLEDLGPTFVKFGQIMSLRPDLLPSELLFELSKLQDEVPPVATMQIRKVVEKGLGQSIESVFSVFDNEPIAAASISQVHRAVLKKEGSIVVAKVQRMT